MATQCPLAHVDAIDTNDLALTLTRDNARRNGVSDRVHTAHASDIPADIVYDEIWSNPPIRIGKQALHDLLSTWLARLAPQGRATLVVSKNLGADSLRTWLEEQGWTTDKLGSSKGFRVLVITA